MTRVVMISGAGIAGQVAAYWLARAGDDVQLVERFPGLRTGGQNVDIRGAARTVVERMGLADAVAGHGTGEVGTRFVDGSGRSLAAFTEDGSAGGGATAEWEILRGQLTTLLADALPESLRTRFDTSIVAVEDDPGSPRVGVRLADGSTEEVDLLVIAEGIGSRTRERLGERLGTVRRRNLGVSIAYFSIPRTAADDQWWSWYNATGGRSVTLRPDNVGRTRVTLSFRSEPVAGSHAGADEARRLLRTIFRGAGWQTDRILDALDDVDDLYLDDIAQIHAPRWSAGRVVLVGDAAHCPSPVSGMGTSLAITGPYLLAHHLVTAPDPATAFQRYEAILRPYVARAQKLPPGAPGLMHPRSRLGVAALRTAFRLAGSGILKPFERRLFHPPADTLVLPDQVDTPFT